MKQHEREFAAGKVAVRLVDALTVSVVDIELMDDGDAEVTVKIRVKKDDIDWQGRP